MEYNKPLSCLQDNDVIEGFYILKNAQCKKTAGGKPYLNAVLADRSGTLEAKQWDYAGLITADDIGKVVKVRGDVSMFKNALQLTIHRLRLASEEDHYILEDLLPCAPIDKFQSEAYIRETVQSIRDRDYRAVCEEMLHRFGEYFFRIPAGKSVHHSFLNGLLMHTENMLRAAAFYAELYPVLDRSLLLAGTLLHDFAKCEEFQFSQLGLVTEYSLSGQLIGHLVLGAQNIAAISAQLEIPEEKSILLQHMILSHHGSPEFGAAVVPHCAEAELLSLIDMADSRMEIYEEALADVPEGCFSPKVYALDKRIYRHTAAETELTGD